MSKITHLKTISFLISFISIVSFGFGQIVAWEMDTNIGNEPTVNATTNDANLNSSALSRGSGLTPHIQNNTFSSVGFTASGTQADAITNNDYLQFQVSTSSGYQVSLSTLDATFRRSNTGPDSFIWRYSTDGINFTDIGTPFSYTVNSGNGTNQTQINLSTILALQNVVSGTTISFRLYGWGANSGTGTFAIGRLAGNDLSLDGVVTITPPCSSAITWNGSWSNGTGPGLLLDTEVTLLSNYNTTTNGGSFSACNLNISNGATLNIANNDYVEVQNDLTVDAGGEITVQAYGAFIQNNDLGVITNNGAISVVKTTSELNNWYEYTYWSSPVSGETIGQGLFESEVSRRFIYNAQNFLDSEAETGNNNATVAGQDGIDDNGNDWQLINGATVMQPAVGYAATHSEDFFTGPPMSSPPYQFDYTFNGTFNNGIITTPIYRNDFETNDINFNLIGNPYPSAIDADLFLAANNNISQDINGTDINGAAYTDGAIYLWSQNTAPSATVNGNEDFNFSASDYAIINGVGQNAGGDGSTPSRFIPSGQGFFISMSDSATPVSSSVNSDGHTISQGIVTFNNAMRTNGTTDNSQFFKHSITKSKTFTPNSNKLWVNLTSDNGVFNQTLVGYVNGATNDNDGSYFDAQKSISTATSAILYTTIDGSNKKFAIQGKATNSLNENEIIKLGFSTNINVATLYKLSISQFEGDFLNSNHIYLKDNLLNKTHDLKVCDYSFTSEVGEYNERFKIGFTAEALSTEDNILDTKQLKIVQLNNDHVQFSTSNNLNIKTIRIFNLLGRQLYNLKGDKSSETYKLSNLKNAIYIAKVELSNGAIITKKSIKN
ncbi:T9SS type A sorting domain-containing protein [Thalassobellus sediminis]|uniref:T9SS type A sorting domain-containing protein n=1 Tax=Thalassobellus sediminis TaxID=3367753 RepID=UPI003791F057